MNVVDPVSISKMPSSKKKCKTCDKIAEAYEAEVKKTKSLFATVQKLRDRAIDAENLADQRKLQIEKLKEKRTDTRQCEVAVRDLQHEVSELKKDLEASRQITETQLAMLNKELEEADDKLYAEEQAHLRLQREHQLAVRRILFLTERLDQILETNRQRRRQRMEFDDDLEEADTRAHSLQ